MVHTATKAAESGGIAKFGACLSGKKAADVVLLIDESGSLQESDPQAARVDASQYLLKQWSALSIESGVKIAIQTMGFSEDVMHKSGKWLDAGSAYPTIKEDLEAFRSRNQGQQTDYWMALDGARKALAERARGGGSSCQAILWFSDGKLDAFATYAGADGEDLVKPYLERETDNATAAAAKDLCRKGGVADQVRSSGIATFGIGLQAGTAVAGDLDLMKGIALGRDCGAVPAAGTGDFRLATDIDALIMAFDALRTPGQLPLSRRLKICQGEICQEDLHRFVLDNSITRVHIAASAKADNLKLFIVPPKGGPVEVPMSGEKTVKVRAAEVTIDGLSPRTVSLDFRNTGRWTGQWGVVFVDPQRASKGADSVTNLELSADIEPSVDLPDDNIYAGERSLPISLGLRHHDGTVIDPADLLGTVKMDATFTDASGRVLPVATGLDAKSLSDPISLDLTSAAEGTGLLTATVTLTTADIKSAKNDTIPGTTLAPSSAGFEVPVLPPVGYPSVGDSLSFGTATGAAKVATSIVATGPGCVWFDAPQVVAAPEKAGAVAVTSSADSAATCVKLAEGESKDIPVEFTTAKAANGSVNGTLSAHLAPIDEPDRARTKAIAFAANLDKPAKTTTKYLTFALALLAGIGIPVGLMYLVKRMSSKVPPLPLLGGVFNVSVEGGQVLRDGVPFALQPQDLRDPIPVPAGGASTLSVGPAQLQVRNGWSPLGPGVVLATIAGAAGMSSTRSTPRKGGAAELPLAIHNNWALFSAPERGPGHGQLLLLVSGDAPQQQRQDILDRAVAAVPQHLGKLAGEIPHDGAQSGLSDPDGGQGVDGPSLADPDSWTASGSGTGLAMDPWGIQPTGRSADPREAATGSTTWEGSATDAGPNTAGPSDDPWSVGESAADSWTQPSGDLETDPWASPPVTASTSAASDPWNPLPADTSQTASDATPDPWAQPVARAVDPWVASPAAETGPTSSAPRAPRESSQAANEPLAEPEDPDLWATRARGPVPSGTKRPQSPDSVKPDPPAEDDHETWPTQPRSRQDVASAAQPDNTPQPAFDFSNLDDPDH